MVATGWLIAGGILLFILILLSIPVVVWFDYGETLRLRVKYLFFTLYQLPAKPKKRKKNKKAKKQNKKSAAEKSKAPQHEAQDKPTEHSAAPSAEDKKSGKPKKKEKDPKKPTLSEIFEIVKVAVESLSKPLKKLCRRIKICEFELNMICGGEDAAKAALNFGRMNLLVTNALGWIGSFFTLKTPHIDINVDFQSEETVTECFFKAKVNALAALAFAFTFLGRLIVRAFKSEKVKGYLGRLRGKSDKKKQ